MKINYKDIALGSWSRLKTRWPALSYGAIPLIVLSGFVVASVVGYAYISANLDYSRKLATKQQFQNNEQRIATEMAAYANIIRASAGIMQEGGNADTEGKWNDFISIFKLEERFKGVEVVAVAKGDTIQSATITYISPLMADTAHLIGSAPAQNPRIAKAMQQSLKTNTSTLVGPLTNVVSSKGVIGGNSNGFYIVKPYYDHALPHETLSERTQSLRGFSIAMFRGDRFFNEIYKNVVLANKRVEIYLGDSRPANLMYETDRTTEADKTITVQKLKLYGHLVTIIYTQDTSQILPLSATYLPSIILLSGLGLGLAVALISGYVLRNRYQKLMTQKEREVNFAKDELLSMASHQLRTPATGVKQYLGMVLQGFSGDITEQQRKYLEQAYRSNNRQLHIINDILHLAKLESGRIVLAEHRFDIAEMIREVVDEQRSDATGSNVRLKLTAPSSGMMIGDSHMLRMVVENLISNAIKYTNAQGIVTIRLNKRGMHWMFTVKDTGVGIAKKDQAKLFKQFSRITNSRSDFVTGTGIGLYLAHHLVVLHGGTISVSSQEGKGSTFIVRLPRKM